MKNNHNIEEEEIAINIKHVNKRIYESAKQFLKSQYGTHYAHMGGFLSFCIKHTLESVYGINVDEFPPKPIVVRKNIPDPSKTQKRGLMIKICRALLEWPEEKFDKKSIRGAIIKVYEESTGFPPSRWTVDRNMEYLVDRGALIKNIYSNTLKINHKRLREIIKNLGG